jgi:hypothetical protein
MVFEKGSRSYRTRCLNCFSVVGLDGVLSSWGGLNLLLWSILVKLHKLGQIELGLLEDLDLSDHAAVILEREDFGAAFLLDLLANITFNPI